MRVRISYLKPVAVNKGSPILRFAANISTTTQEGNNRKFPFDTDLLAQLRRRRLHHLATRRSRVPPILQNEQDNVQFTNKLRTKLFFVRLISRKEKKRIPSHSHKTYKQRLPGVILLLLPELNEVLRAMTHRFCLLTGKPNEDKEVAVLK